VTAIRTRRLAAGDRDLARDLFAMMAAVFVEESGALSDGYLDRLLGGEDFWAIAALAGNDVVGGLTAHTLPMTRSESSEVFIYDIAVRQDHQRQGVGRQLVSALRDAASAAEIQDVFVPADNEDADALEFYRALGGQAAPVTFFTFSPEGE
jgi:aminoglycoside 3-N-acetyltransferase I